jgi:RHS repeat-associated protein
MTVFGYGFSVAPYPLGQIIKGDSTRVPLWNEYDRNGRRTVLHLNQQTQKWIYDPDTGLLGQIRDIKGKEYRFGWNTRSELISLAYPNGITEVRGYDQDGRVIRRSGGPGGVVALTYDQRNRILSATDAGTYEYNGLGYLLRAQSYGGLLEEFSPDENGSLNGKRVVSGGYPLEYSLSGGASPSSSATYYCYSEECSNDPYIDTGSWSRSDVAGNLTMSVFSNQALIYNPFTSNPEGSSLEAGETNYGYGADEKLRYTQRTHRWQYDKMTGQYYKWEGELTDYQYDAFGRRVRRSSRANEKVCNTSCYTDDVRFIWDGDQIVWENGLVYTHGLEIDLPLSLYREQMFVPHTNSRGLVSAVTDSLGKVKCTNICDLSGSGRGSYLGIPESQSVLRTGAPYGSLLSGQADPNGLMYRRNRYYNPESGQFTQPDPIGIAGGANAFGYANGDPINFSDPFGLCPDPGETICRGVFTSLYGTIGAVLGAYAGGGMGGGGGLVACSVSGPGALGCGLAAGTAGAAGGAVVGGAAGIAYGSWLDGLIFKMKSDIQQIRDAATHYKMTAEQRREFGDYIESEKEAGRGGTKNSRGDYKWPELLRKAREFLGGL